MYLYENYLNIPQKPSVPKGTHDFSPIEVAKRNFQPNFVEYLTASKAYSEDKNKDKFDLIRQGAVITKGELYQWFDRIME